MVSQLKVNEIVKQSGSNLTIGGSGDNIVLGSGATTSFGKIGQVKFLNYGDRTVVSSATFTSTPLTVSITPTFTSSKVLVMVSLLGGSGSGSNSMMFQIRRGTSTVIAPDTSQSLTGYYEGFMLYSDGDNNVTRTYGFTVLDSPATDSSTDYTVYIRSQTGSTSAILNGSFNDNASQTYSHRASSTITVMEVLP